MVNDCNYEIVVPRILAIVNTAGSSENQAGLSIFEVYMLDERPSFDGPADGTLVITRRRSNTS